MTCRVAVLGCGIGAKHIDGYLDVTDRLSVTHVCDLNPDLAAVQAGRTGARAVTDIAAVLADPGVDIIDICLPPAMHVPVACEALAAGKHVIVEKPIAGSVAEADRLVKVSQETGRRVFPVFQYRFGRAFAQLRALEAAGLTGAPRVASLETHWNRNAGYYAAASWRGTWDREMGGAILSHAIHIHDLIACFFGPVADVSAMLATSINPIETEDCAALAFRMRGGALVTSSVTLGAANDTSRLRLVFEHLTAESGSNPYAPGEDCWRFFARDPLRQPVIDRAVAEAPVGPEGFAGFLAAVANAFDGEPDDAVSLRDGLNSIELVSAIYLADRTGARVSLPLDRDLPICAGWRPGSAA
ncbi:MAG: Gfo/Idh/MocA family oxidoreductase [Geminicoccaceae bacterium]